MSERDEFERFVTDKFFDIEKDHIGYTSWATAFAWKVWQDTRAAARATPPQAVPSLTPKAIKEMAWEAHNLAARIPGATPYNAAVFALEAVRDLLDAPQPSQELKEPAHAHDWRFSLQDHLYKCDCGETRGDYPFGAASFKD